jgi:dCTP deaminase
MLNDGMIRRLVFPERYTDRPDVGRVAYVPRVRWEWNGIEESQIQPASLDVRLSTEFIRHPDGYKFAIDFAKGGTYLLSPGECVLASTVERLSMPDNLVARVEGKSSLAREFLTIHSAGFIDPGFHGDVTLEIKNDGFKRVGLRPGMLIAQLSFQKLDAPAERQYGHPELKSHYQGQVGPTESAGR